jgi:MFS family permease
MGNPSNFETYFSLLYTLYSIPNIILPFFGGYFVDKIGVRLCLIIFVVLIACGQVIFAFGVSIKSWPVMFVGRVVYGFGGESISVANSSIMADWFAGKELAFAFGLNLSVARLGSVFNNLLSPILAESAGVPFALWFGTILCASSVGCAFLIAPIDKAMEVKLGIQSEQVDESQKFLDKKEFQDEEEEVSLKDIKKFTTPFWILVISCVVVYGREE